MNNADAGGGRAAGLPTERLEEITARHAEASGGRWGITPSGWAHKGVTQYHLTGPAVGREQSLRLADAAFFGSAHDDVGDLLAEVRRLQPYEAAIRAAHNGYDPDARAAMPELREPATPADAIRELLEEERATERAAWEEASVEEAAG